MLTCLYETTLADWLHPRWRSARTAAMAHVSCAFTWGTDPIEPLRPQMPAICDYLLSLPEHLRCLYAYGIGVAGVKEWNGSPAHDWTSGKQPDPSIGNQQAKYIASCLGERGVTCPLVFTDYEEPHFLPNGSYAPQSSRVKYMKAVLAPLGGEKINFNFVRFPASKPVCDGYGNPMGSGTIGRTSNPCSYSDSREQWKQHRRDVENCYGPVIPHLPARYSKDGVQKRQPEDALQETYDAIIWDAARGVTTWTLATFEFENNVGPHTGQHDQLVGTVADALEAADMSSAGVNT
jgi:hypothetical protein